MEQVLVLAQETSHDETVFMALERVADICYRGEVIFGQAVQFEECAEFRGGVGRVRQLLHEFGFQLRAELQRLENPSSSTFFVAGDDRSNRVSYPSCLRRVLDTYEEVLDVPLPARTRAMVNRQYLQLKELWNELNRFVQVLQRLMDPSVFLPSK